MERIKMTDKLKFLVPALLAGFILVGCGQAADTASDAMETTTDAMDSAAEAATDAAEAVADTATDAAEAVAEAASDEPGGYVPTADELIPGETRP